MLTNRHVRKGEDRGGACGCVIIGIIVVVVFSAISNNREPGGAEPETGGSADSGSKVGDRSRGPTIRLPEIRFSKPVVPVIVSYRWSAWGKGKVAIFSNQTDKRMTIGAKFENAKLRQQKTVSIDLPPNGTAEFGWLEGWKFEPGETIELSHPEYTSRTTTIP